MADLTAVHEGVKVSGFSSREALIESVRDSCQQNHDLPDLLSSRFRGAGDSLRIHGCRWATGGEASLVGAGRVRVCGIDRWSGRLDSTAFQPMFEIRGIHRPHRGQGVDAHRSFNAFLHRLGQARLAFAHLVCGDCFA